MLRQVVFIAWENSPSRCTLALVVSPFFIWRGKMLGLRLPSKPLRGFSADMHLRMGTHHFGSDSFTMSAMKTMGALPDELSSA